MKYQYQYQYPHQVLMPLQATISGDLARVIHRRNRVFFGAGAAGKIQAVSANRTPGTNLSGVTHISSRRLSEHLPILLREQN